MSSARSRSAGTRASPPRAGKTDRARKPPRFTRRAGRGASPIPRARRSSSPARPPSRRSHAALEDAEQRRLDRRLQLADLVEKTVPHVRRLERADVARMAPVNAPFSGRTARCRIASAAASRIDGDQRPAAARPRSWSARAISSLPVRTLSPVNQRRDVALRGLRDLRHQPPHRRRSPGARRRCVAAVVLPRSATPSPSAARCRRDDRGPDRHHAAIDPLHRAHERAISSSRGPRFSTRRPSRAQLRVVSATRRIRQPAPCSPSAVPIITSTPSR